MSIAQFLRILMARRFIIIAVVTIASVIAVALTFILPPRYPATARVLMDLIKPDPVSGAVISSGFVRGYSRTQIELITDYRVAGDVVDRLGWESNPVLVADFRKNSNGTEDFRRYHARQIIEHTDAELVSGSNILEISYYSGNPILARNVVTALRTAYIDASLRLKSDAAGRSADWYVDQAKKAQTALSEAEATKSAFERKNGLVMASGGSDSESLKLDGMQNALLAARGSAGMSEINTQRGMISSPALEAVKAQLNGVEDQIALAGERLGKSHPTSIALAQRRGLLQGQLARETAAARALGGTVASGTQSNIGRLEADYAAQKAKVLALKPTLNELAQLQREVDLRRTQYEKAAARTADLKLEADVSETGLVPLGDAVVSGSPSFPNKPLVLAIGVLGGFALGLVLALIVEMISRRVRGPEDLAVAAKVAVLAVIADTAPVGFASRIGQFLRVSSRKAEWQPAQ